MIRVLVRGLTGFVALAALLATAALVDPSPEELPTRTPTTVDVVAADLPSGCPGWLQLPVGEMGEGDGGFGPGSSDVSRGVYASGADQPVSLGIGSSTVSDVATSIERIGAGDLAGLAAASCIEPRSDSWLVGGSTRLGNSARLVLVNPSSVISRVVVTVYGPSGTVDQPIIRSLGPDSSESILLEGVASELATLVIHVEAGGAGVVAMVQDSRLNGFLPAGSEWVTPTAAPATSLVIPGVGPSDPDGPDGAATVRLMAPEGATVALRLADAQGSVPWPGASSIRLDPGVAVDVDIPASAISSIVILSDQPVVAGALAQRSRQPEEGPGGYLAFDTVWVNAQTPDAGASLLAILSPYTSTLVAYASSLTTLTVLNAATEETLAVTVVGAGTTVEVPLDAPPGTVIAIRGDVSWVVRLSDDTGFVTAIQPVDVRDYSVPITVVPGTYVP